jgi:cytochrome c oxidase subunit II
MVNISRRSWLRRACVATAAVLAGWRRTGAQEPDGLHRVSMTARRYEFDPAVIDVRRNDIVHITIASEDIAHSFTIDGYRIQKRIPPGGATTFEFRADEVGRFPFYCSMQADSGCREMRGELVVR